MVPLPFPEPAVIKLAEELVVEVEFELPPSLGVMPAQTFLKSAIATSVLEPHPLEMAPLTEPAFLPQMDFRSAGLGCVLFQASACVFGWSHQRHAYLIASRRQAGGMANATWAEAARSATTMDTLANIVLEIR